MNYSPYCNMNAFFSFGLIYGLYTRTAKNYEIIHADTRYCTL